MTDEASEQTSAPQKAVPRASNGWDGKLRVTKDDENELPSDPEGESDDEGFPQTEVEGYKIDADEDLLDEIPDHETEIDLNHCRIASIPSLHLERFPKIERLCLRQNHITHPDFPSDWGEELVDLDLYDNAIAHVKGFDTLTNLTSLDLSFNKIKHIKRVNHLHKLRDLYFVQNKITKIENLDGLTEVKNLELAANRIREIENLDTLTGLEQLWLGKNKLTELKNLTPLTNLTLLSIQSNRLTSDSLTHLQTLPALAELYISHNALEHVRPLATCTALRTLDISANPLASIAGLAPLALLEELWASDCRLDSFEELERELRDKPALDTVYFEGNPLQLRQRALYRNKVRLALPQVKQIDATVVRVD